MKKEDFGYELPGELIAREPDPKRDGSRLLVYDTATDTVHLDRFFHVHKYLPSNALLVLNETKVLPSRISLRKDTGGKVKLLFLVNEQMTEGQVRAFADRKIETGDRLSFNDGRQVEVVAQHEHIFTLGYGFSRETLYRLLEDGGSMPIPLYIKHSPLNDEELKTKYQTIFARSKGSSAAPTASLHFTENTFRNLAEKGIDRGFVTLHVGMGTFAPVDDSNIREKKLHREWYEIPDATVQKLRENGTGPVIAAGTTVVRTLETYAKSGKQTGETDIFIFPPYRFRSVDHLITNFHLPESSLMMLVEAFLQHKKAKRRLVELYRIAISERFRFYSFGDAMLIL